MNSSSSSHPWRDLLSILVSLDETVFIETVPRISGGTTVNLLKEFDWRFRHPGILFVCSFAELLMCSANGPEIDQHDCRCSLKIHSEFLNYYYYRCYLKYILFREFHWVSPDSEQSKSAPSRHPENSGKKESGRGRGSASFFWLGLWIAVAVLLWQKNFFLFGSR